MRPRAILPPVGATLRHVPFLRQGFPQARRAVPGALARHPVAG